MTETKNTALENFVTGYALAHPDFAVDLLKKVGSLDFTKDSICQAIIGAIDTILCAKGTPDLVSIKAELSKSGTWEGLVTGSILIDLMEEGT